MKKIIAFILVIIISLALTGCYNDIEKNSLEEYIACIKQNNCGFTSTSIDAPEFFLPSISFLEEYEYLEGTYFLRADDPSRGLFATEGVFPEIALLALKYEEGTYEKAKQTMLDEIKPHGNDFFQYNDYTFYVNRWSNFFPEQFTMACYNDENHTLMFIGFFANCDIEEKYSEDIEGNWESFVDQYYGAYYDFSQ